MPVKKDGVDYSLAADLTGQANHLGVTIEADIIKQTLPTTNGGFTALNFGKTADAIYAKLTSDHPIDLCRYQVLSCYSGPVGLINSGGDSVGAGDLTAPDRAAVINKRAGGTRLISGRQALQRPMSDGVHLLNAIQDVYLNEKITIAQPGASARIHRRTTSNARLLERRPVDGFTLASTRRQVSYPTDEHPRRGPRGEVRRELERAPDQWVAFLARSPCELRRSQQWREAPGAQAG